MALTAHFTTLQNAAPKEQGCEINETAWLPSEGCLLHQQSGCWWNPLWSCKDWQTRLRKEESYSVAARSLHCIHFCLENPSLFLPPGQVIQPVWAQPEPLWSSGTCYLHWLCTSLQQSVRVLPFFFFLMVNVWLLLPYAGSYCIPRIWHKPSLVPTAIMHSHEYHIIYNKLPLMKDRDNSNGSYHWLYMKWKPWVKHFINYSYHHTNPQD